MIASLFFFLVVLECTWSARLNNCSDDSDCDGGEYCYASTKFCTPCVSCASYRRSNPSGDVCVKDPQGCGDCIDGYEEEKLSSGLSRDLCLAAEVHTPLPNTTTPAEERYEWFFYGIGPVVVLSLLAALCFVTRGPDVRIRARTPVQSCNIQHPLLDGGGSLPESVNGSREVCFSPSAPPPYEAGDCMDGHIICHKETLQQANPYLEPQWVTNVPNANAYVEPATTVDEVDGLPNGVPNPTNTGNASTPDFHDEETVQSSWSPPQGYGAEGGGVQPSELITSFAGLLNSSSSSSHSSSNNSSPSTPSASDISQLNINITVINNSNGVAGVSNIFGSSL